MATVIELPITTYEGIIDSDWCPGCGDFGIWHTLERGRLGVAQQSIKLAHALLLNLAAHRRRREDVADQYSFFVMIVGGGDIKGSFGAGQSTR